MIGRKWRRVPIIFLHCLFETSGSLARYQLELCRQGFRRGSLVSRKRVLNKMVCCMFDHSFRCPSKLKYHGATSPPMLFLGNCKLAEMSVSMICFLIPFFGTLNAGFINFRCSLIFSHAWLKHGRRMIIQGIAMQVVTIQNPRLLKSFFSNLIKAVFFG